MNGEDKRLVSIVDYGVGNLGSIRNMLQKIGFDVAFVSTPAGVVSAENLILPGVGAFDHGMAALVERGLAQPLRQRAAAAAPILGICLGMQLLGRGSEEGSSPGLGIIDGACVRFRFPVGSRLKVPHMGWNELAPKRFSPLLAGLESGARFYFTHSYRFVCDDPSDVLAVADHGGEFTAVVQRGSTFGVQFHPEKSHRFGMSLLKNFGSM